MSDEDQLSGSSGAVALAIIMPVVIAPCVVFGVLALVLLPVFFSGNSGVADGLPNRLVLVNTAGQIETVAPTGEQRRTLTASDMFYQFPSWSPEDDAIAVIGSDGSRGGIFVLEDSADSRPRTIYQDADAPIYHYWSPDGTQISFIANHSRSLGLYMAARDGVTDPVLLTTGQPFYWDWHDDGSEMLIHTGVPGGRTARLAFIAPDGDGSGDSIAEPGFFQSPDIAPSGAYVAYAQVDESQRQVVVRNMVTGDETLLDHNQTTALAWNPQGDQLAFVAPPDSAETGSFGPLHLIDATTGAERVLVEDFVLAFFWSPDGRQIAYLTLRPEFQGSESADATLQRIAQRHPRVTLDLWVTTVGDGAEEDSAEWIAVFEPSLLFLTQFLPFYDQYSRSHALWSPASDAIALPIQLGEEPVIAVFPSDGSEPTIISDGLVAFWSHR